MKSIGTNVNNNNYRQIWLNQLGIFTDYQVRKLQKKVGVRMFSNCKLIFGSTPSGYILGIETDIQETDENIINYFIRVLICSL